MKAGDGLARASVSPTLGHSPRASPWSCDRWLQPHRGIEQLQIHVLYFMAPAAPRMCHHRQAHHVASHVHVQGQLVGEV